VLVHQAVLLFVLPLSDIDSVEGDAHRHQDGVDQGKHHSIGKILIVLVIRFLTHEEEVQQNESKDDIVLPVLIVVGLVDPLLPVLPLVVVHEEIDSLGNEGSRVLDAVRRQDTADHAVEEPNHHNEAAVSEEIIGHLLV